MSEIKIKDKSGDKDFFTIIPNYVANHSTANDQALYLQMKRFAGETGECFATSRTLMKQLGIGRKAFNTALQYLLDKKWISFVGVTQGKTRPVKTYTVNNIWKLNNHHYKKISSERTLTQEISLKRTGDKSQKHTKISPERTLEEEPLIRRTKKKRIRNLKKDFTSSFFEENKTTKVVIYFEKLCVKNLGVKPTKGAKENKMAQQALKLLTDKEIKQLLKDWFDSDREPENLIQITQAFSRNNINRFKVNNHA